MAAKSKEKSLVKAHNPQKAFNSTPPKWCFCNMKTIHLAVSHIYSLKQNMDEQPNGHTDMLLTISLAPTIVQVESDSLQKKFDTYLSGNKLMKYECPPFHQTRE